MSLTRIERWDVRRDGPLSETALQRKIEALGFEVAARIYPAGAATLPPLQQRISIAGIVRGLVRLTIDDEQVHLTAGDLAFVPGGAVRTLEVMGPGTALCLEAYPRAEAAPPEKSPA